MDEYRLVKKLHRKKSNNKKEIITFKRYLLSLLNRALISGLILVISLCLVKKDTKVKNYINENVYNKNISFAKINNVYEKLFGKVYPIEKIEKNTSVKIEPVFSEKLTYLTKEDYKDGVKLTVDDNYLVPVVESGIIVYAGDKDNYGYTIIIQQVNGIDMWYVGIKNSNLKLYEYVEKGSLLGETIDNNLYLYYQKDGKFVSYKDHLG